ncbi:hypothetical protein GGF31_007709 [Allomyces arbusculus]|nr:hypothetical protein GGF31_007709 [Allomyces arbusculus]
MADIDPAVAHLAAPEDVEVDTHSENPAESGPRTIFMPIDASSASQHTLRWARTNYLKADDTVIIAHVRHATPGSSLSLVNAHADVVPALEALEAAAREASHDLVRAAAATLRDTELPGVAVTDVKGFALRGEVRKDLVRKAKEVNADVIIVGSRGLGAVKRALLGSVSEYLARHAHCAVVVVRPTDAEAIADKLDELKTE